MVKAIHVPVTVGRRRRIEGHYAATAPGKSYILDKSTAFCKLT